MNKLVGVVGFESIGGLHSKGGPCQAVVLLCAWRIDDGPVTRGNMRVLIPALPKAIDALRARFEVFSLIEVRVSLGAEIVEATLSVDMSEVHGPVIDTQLVAECERLKTPVNHSEQLFGSFRLDRSLNQFERKLKWSGVEVPVYLDADDDRPSETALDSLRSQSNVQESLVRQAKDAVVGEFLSLYNDEQVGWRLEEDLTLTAEQFVERLKIESVAFRRDKTTEVWIDDGDLFRGHGFVVKFQGDTLVAVSMVG